MVSLEQAAKKGYFTFVPSFNVAATQSHQEGEGDRKVEFRVTHTSVL